MRYSRHPLRLNSYSYAASAALALLLLNSITPAVKENEIDLQFRFGVQQVGRFRVFVIVEVLP